MLDEHLLREQMLAAYREIAPDAGPAGEFLIRRLATAIFERGARIEIGAALPTDKKLLHQSLGLDHCFVWVCKLWAEVMGVRPHAVIGRHISTALTPDTCSNYIDRFWPSLLARGKAEEDVTLVTASGTPITGHAKGEVLKDSEGSFVRTFTRITVFIPRIVGALGPLSTGWYDLIS